MRNFSVYTDLQAKIINKIYKNLIIPAVSNIVEPKGEGRGKTCPQEEINAPTLKGPKSNPITLVLAKNSSLSSMHFFFALPHFPNRDLG